MREQHWHFVVNGEASGECTRDAGLAMLRRLDGAKGPPCYIHDGGSVIMYGWKDGTMASVKPCMRYHGDSFFRRKPTPERSPMEQRAHELIKLQALHVNQPAELKRLRDKHKRDGIRAAAQNLSEIHNYRRSAFK